MLIPIGLQNNSTLEVDVNPEAYLWTLL